MLKTAQEHPVEDPDRPGDYSANEEEAFERHVVKQPELGIWQLEVGLAVVVQYEARRLLSLTISLDPSEYRLSAINVVGPSKFARIPDELAAILLTAFFGDKGKEVPNPSGLKDARHFVCTQLPQSNRLD